MLNLKRVKDLELPAIPCGLVAKSFFNDTFELYKCFEGDCKTNLDKMEKVQIESQDIAWSSDVSDKFDNIKNSPATIDGKTQIYQDI
jgi:hypothetical protein